MYHFNLNNTIEDLRFKLWERQYEAAVEEVLPVLAGAEDTDWGNHEIKIFPPLALGREVQYRKQGDSIAIYFSTFHSLFTNGGFIYFSDEAIEEYFGDLSNFKEGWVESADVSYDYVKLYNENWAYIILY